ncbi:isopeptide-forming domain-containing fimbrial protein [Anaerococcus vaginalis]|uniref:LPXTG-motif cell wall anchor domain protein n=2 Tax=Anaerococcus vaginalis TaxID=33037 RepID=C7HW59_9FIRM|nr:pilin N-terminal domain-containing protein [Anaerococcus vaginalis]EEU12161.1 LPXTG-motif cell wall anchor domain protein [Anaerococcus vaginalis ATCC 51170]QQB61792.1 isopeptide-forming domain-containing fimbrial protein [Anaerococcus vaginalis]
MKHKILSFLTAFAMVFGIVAAPFVNASAADDEKTETVTVHKILMDKTSFNAFDVGTTGKDGTKYDGNKIANVKDFFVAKENTKGTATEIEGAYFVVKNADGTKFIKEDGTETDKEEEALKGKTTKDGLVLNTSNLKKGTYKIYEDQSKSSYKNADGQSILADAKAVPIEIALPLVNDNGVVKNAHVYPKNTEDKPLIDKNFKYEQGKSKVAEGYKAADEGAGAEVGAKYENSDKTKATVTSELGKKIPFEVKTKIPAKAKYKKLVWDDQMEKGLVYNKDLTISGLNLEKGTDYKVYETNRGFRLVMQDSGLKKVEEAAEKGEVELTLTYSAHLDGTVKPDQVKENNVTFDYSNKPGDENEPPETKPADQKIKVSKTWAADGPEITEADRHVKAVFTLQEKQNDGSWKDVAEYESNYKENFEHEFTGLDNAKTYRVVESVSGYEPQYQKTTEDGKVVIVDKIDNDNPKTLKPTTPKVVNGGRRFVKTDSEDTPNRLAGAEFYVKDSTGKKYLVAKSSTKADAESIDVSEKKTALDNAVKAYNELSAEQQKGEAGKEKKAAIDKAQKEYNEAFVKAAQAYEWKEATTAPTDAVVLVSDSEGRLEITGLEYGDYKLEEKQAPKGFAKLNGTVDFKVEKGSYDSKQAKGELDYKQEGTQVFGKQIKNKLVSIPQTGGIGSIIFVVAGLMIMGLAAYKMKANKEQA